MASNGFTYENIKENQNCPFCGEHVRAGVSVCPNCQAMHGTKMTGGRFLSGCLMIVILFVAFSASAYVTFGLKSDAGGIAVFLLIFIVGLGGAGKLFSSKGWFR